jgi:hypothetical protein
MQSDGYCALLARRLSRKAGMQILKAAFAESRLKVHENRDGQWNLHASRKLELEVLN